MKEIIGKDGGMTDGIKHTPSRQQGGVFTTNQMGDKPR